MTQSKLIVGRDEICQYLGIGKELFYTLIYEGLPVKKMGNQWISHTDHLDEYFKEKIKPRLENTP